MSIEDWAARQLRRREQDRPINESLSDSLARAKTSAELAAMTRSELLAVIAEQERADSEHRTAVGAAVKQLSWSGEMPRGLVDLAMRIKTKRLDGTTLALEDRKPERNVASDTNNANDITQAPTPLEN